MVVLFPVYVFEKADCSMFLVEKPEDILYQMEEVDIEAGEYLLWDRSGEAVCVSTKNRAVASISYCDRSMALRAARRILWRRRGFSSMGKRLRRP